MEEINVKEPQLVVEQRSAEWFDMRKGKLTASEIHKIISAKPALTETAKTYLLEKVSELLGGTKAPAVGAALDWGTDLEESAIAFYERKTENVVEKASFIPFGNNAGGSPDGLVPASNGIIEVKCPFNSANHFKHGLIKSNEDFKKAKPEYYWQCVMNMIVAEADYCDFISFDPRVNPDYIMFVHKVTKTEEVEADIKLLLERIQSSVEYIEELKSVLQTSIM